MLPNRSFFKRRNGGDRELLLFWCVFAGSVPAHTHRSFHSQGEVSQSQLAESVAINRVVVSLELGVAAPHSTRIKIYRLKELERGPEAL